ncbi:target of rapamycin complex 2 subunit Tsc11p [[Candida] anglica]|uniref:Target of rapamycin complex 2 subunit Tsc11p n=1 Tax=[Candida] anglica TaxID=148631 RepID=A0ABP0EAC5_9ASCO
MSGNTRFRSPSLTQSVSITSARSKSDSFNNNIDELTQFLNNLKQIKFDLESELANAAGKYGGDIKQSMGSPTDNATVHNMTLKLKEVTSSITSLEKRLKILQSIEGTSVDNSRSRSNTTSTTRSGEQNTGVKETNIHLHGGPSNTNNIHSIQINGGEIRNPTVFTNSSTALSNLQGLNTLKTSLPSTTSIFNSGAGPSISPVAVPPDSELFDDILPHGNHQGDNTYESSPTWLLSDILQTLSSARDRDEYFLVARGNDLVLLLSQYPQIKQDLVVKTFLNKILFMLCHPVSEVRATVYRIVRYIISDYESLTVLVQSKILIFIIISMARTNCHVEKEQALKLIREFLSVPKGANNLSIGVVKSIIAVIENEDIDPNVEDESKLAELKNICIETMLELTLLKTELVFLSGGLRVLFTTVQDGSIDLAVSSILCVISILDSHDTRRFLRDGYDMCNLVTIFSDSEYGTISSKTKEHRRGASTSKSSTFTYQSKLQRIAFLICLFLKSWSGLMSFAHEDFQPWKILVSSLKRPDDKVREIVLDIFFDLLRLRPLPWIKGSSIGDTISKVTKFTEYNSGSFEYSNLEAESLESSIYHHYLGLVLHILVNKCDIMSTLVSVINNSERVTVTEKSSQLLHQIYKLSNYVLPQEFLSDKQKLLPIDKSFRLSNNNMTHLYIDPTFRALGDDIYGKDGSSVNANDRMGDIKRFVNTIAIDSRYYMDESELKMKIHSTKVLTVKEYNEWNWLILSEIIEGPMRNPKKLEEICKNFPKFLKQVLAFYRPFKFRFCNHVVPSTKSNSSKVARHKYITVGCQLFDALLSTSEGVKYLSTNKILPQISETFAQVDPFSGISAKEPILSRRRLRKTLSYGYIDFIATFSKTLQGLKLLQQWQFYNLFHHLIEGSNNSNSYLVVLLLSKLDFTFDSPMRIVLSKAISVCSLDIKLHIMNKVVPKLMKITECERWVISLLSQRLYDNNKEVSSIAMKHIFNFCSEDESNLIFFISLHPSVNILNKLNKGKNLLMKFLSTSIGFKYLDDLGYVTREFTEWVQFKNSRYSIEVGHKLEEVLFPYVVRDSKMRIDTMPVHFFSNLLQTEEGMSFFQKETNKRYLENLINETHILARQIDDRYDGRYSPVDEEDKVQLLGVLGKLKENLWIIGNIASSKYGIQLLDTEYGHVLSTPIVPLMIHLVQNCPFWHIRGVALYQLGMVASTVEGTEILDELSWISVFDSFNRPRSLCYPAHNTDKGTSCNTVFNVQITNPYEDGNYFTLFGQSDDTIIEELSDITAEREDSITSYWNEEDIERYQNRVLTLINHLSAVLSKIERKASKELLYLKKNIPDLFARPVLFSKVVKLIDKGRYKLRVRRFVFSLFLDTRILETLVKKDKKQIIR